MKEINKNTIDSIIKIKNNIGLLPSLSANGFNINPLNIVPTDIIIVNKKTQFSGIFIIFLIKGIIKPIKIKVDLLNQCIIITRLVFLFFKYFIVKPFKNFCILLLEALKNEKILLNLYDWGQSDAIGSPTGKTMDL